MDTTHDDDRISVYEVGYLIVSSIPEEHVPKEAEAIKKIITDAGATVITEEAPQKHDLSYTMRKKTVAGSYDTYDSAYFGWIKFEVGSDKVEAVKKNIELLPNVLRMILINTVRENTYLGKRASALLAKPELAGEEKDVKIDPAAVTVEEMDKSIDAMVKEVVA